MLFIGTRFSNLYTAVSFGTSWSIRRSPLALLGILAGLFDTSRSISRSLLTLLVLAVICWARAPRGGVSPQGVVLTDLQSLLDCQYSFSLARARSSLDI